MGRKPPFMRANANRARSVTAKDRVRDSNEPLDVRVIYDAHADFVWLSLQRLGVQPADLDDVAQEVFMVVHRRLESFDRTGRITTWLFGICLRVAANYRRRRRSVARCFLAIPATIVLRPSLRRMTFSPAAKSGTSRSGRSADLDVEKRATFVMFEVESLSCEEIAKIMNVPVGTVYSRLHAARRQLEKAIARRFRRRR